MKTLLHKHLSWLGAEGCPCSWRWGGYGVLHGVSMGEGWIRTGTDPACPHHGGRQ